MRTWRGTTGRMTMSVPLSTPAISPAPARSSHEVGLLSSGLLHGGLRQSGYCSQQRQRDDNHDSANAVAGSATGQCRGSRPCRSCACSVDIHNNRIACAMTASIAQSAGLTAVNTLPIAISHPVAAIACEWMETRLHWPTQP